MEEPSLLNEPGVSISGSASSVDREWEIAFHGVAYTINLTVANSLLTLEVEDNESNERWSGEFTAQYIEDITLKAGNFKKFPTFVKMLCSGLSKDNESVFLDMLTAEDLDMLKARKAGKATSSLAPPSAPQPGGKRYVILTYSGEFDRVHYPLPLAFEAAPNPQSLLRTVVRLRRRLSEQSEQHIGLDDNNGSDTTGKELRQIIANLRQENQEMRHRLRQADSRNKSTVGTGPPAQTGLVAELTTANAKLKRQVDLLRKELADATALHERQRTEAAKELHKWKLRVGASSRDRLEFYSRGEVGGLRSLSPGGAREGEGAGQDELLLLRRRVSQLERELALARVNRRPSGVGIGSTAAGGVGSGAAAPSSGHVPGSAAAAKERPWSRPPSHLSAGRRSVTPPPLSSIQARHSGGGSSSFASAGGQQHAWSPSATATARVAAARGSPGSATRLLAASTARARARGASSAWAVGRRSVSAASAASSREKGGELAPRARSVSPSLAHGQQRISSSVGGRFDPTLYQQQRAERHAHALNGGIKPFTAGGARRPLVDSTADSYAAPGSGLRHRRSRESGYSSNDSGGGGGRDRLPARASSKSPGVGETSASAGTRKVASRRKSKGPRRASRSIAAALQSDSEDESRLAASGSRAGVTNSGTGRKIGIAERSDLPAPTGSLLLPSPFPSVEGRIEVAAPPRALPSKEGGRSPSSRVVAASSPPRRLVSAATRQTTSLRDFPSSATCSPRVESKSEDIKGVASPLSALKNKGEDEISEIDRRIQALQSYLDNARTGLLSETKQHKTH